MTIARFFFVSIYRIFIFRLNFVSDGTKGFAETVKEKAAESYVYFISILLLY